MVVSSKVINLETEFFEALEPPPDLTIDQWADKYRILSSEASAEPGPWRTERFPFMKEVMECLSPQSDVEEIVLMSGSQVAKTENCLNLIGYHIHYDPCPILYMQKTVEAVERFSKQRFKKSLENTPELKARISPEKSRDGSNTMTLKNFPGGVIIMGGANSAASLRSMPIRILLLDEEDSYELDVQKEGDPIQLAIRRTSNFPGRKIFHLSTPGIRETSRIEPLFDEGDQRYYYVPCPFCDHKQTLRWSNIKYDVQDLGNSYRINDVYLECEKCEGHIHEHYKTQMLEGGKWIAQNPGVDIASFHLNSLYSPLGFYSWRDVVKLWMKYKRSRSQEQLKVFINTVLGETFSQTGKNVDYSILNSHRSLYASEVPKGVKVLFAGVDIQDDRIEVEVMGVGNNMETWSIAYRRFMGDPEHALVWDSLDDFLERPFIHESGQEMFIMGAGIDSGFKAKIVYDYCKKREYKRFMPIKGAGGWGKGIIDRPLRRNKEGVWLHHIYVDEMKSRVYSYLQVETPGPGFCHFPDKPEYDENYFMMLTAERLEPKIVAGQKRLKWTLIKNRRNEALDCRNYALGIMYILYPEGEEAINRLEDVQTPQNIKAIPQKKIRRIVSKGLA